MRSLWVAALALVSGLSVQVAPPVDRVVVVIDGDTPSADATSAASLRDAVLQTLDGVPASYFELKAGGLTRVPDDQALSFRRSRFTVAPPSYRGVAITFAEGVEVLRGNEFARDSLIERECPASPGECAGQVHAAVTAEVRRVEATSAAKLRVLVAQANVWRGARVLLFTAGWPTRDDARVGLGAALRDLRARGLSLVVVRVPPRDPYRGLVRDAAESLAAQLPSGFVILSDEQDVAHAALVAGEGVPAATRAAVTGEVAPAPHASEPAAIDVPAPQPPPIVAIASQPERLDPAVSEVVAPPIADPILRRAAAYVDRFERTFTSVMWHERYEQEDRVWRRLAASGAMMSTVAGRRILESELFFAWLPQDATWISVRDVVTVDGQPRPAGERRLPPLATRTTVSLPELRELARENGRFNLGQIVRTFNEPTLALLFLDARHRAGVKFTAKAHQRIDGRTLATYEFVEQRRPTLIRSGERNVPVSGTFRIDEATGAVWSTSIEVSEPATGLTGSMAVDYRPHVTFDVLVPHEMRETYASAGTEQVTAVASYSDFRRFQTTGRLILTP